MTIFRNILDNRLYIIENVIRDIYYTNNNSNSGVYAKPFKWKGAEIIFISKNENEKLNFVTDNFISVAVQ